MKENLLIPIFAILLLVSLSISSQTTDRLNDNGDAITLTNIKTLDESSQLTSDNKHESAPVAEAEPLSDAESAQLRNLFLQAEKAIKKND